MGIIERKVYRDRCLLPLKLALESRVSKLAGNAINGLQKLISDDRFRSHGEEDIDAQLPVQFINAVVSTPSLTDEVQVEIMKMLLIITCSASCEVHGEYLIKIAEICIKTYTRAHQQATKTACRATLTQMLSSVCHRLQESLNHTQGQKDGSDIRIIKPGNLSSTDNNKILSQDVVLLLKHFCFRLTSGPSSPSQQSSSQPLPLYLEAILVMLGSLFTSLQEDKEFITVIWQLLCPALIQLLGSPITDLNKKHKLAGSTEDINRGGRGSGNFPKVSPVVGPVPRTIYNIANELLRLVGPLAAMRPVLESLFHRIILYPPTYQRTEALKALKEIFASPQRLLDAAGPTIIDKDNPPSPDSPTEQKKSDLDLLRLMMDGVVESAHCADSTVASCSVACVVALLGSLEDLSQGRGLSDEHIEWLNKLKESDSWEELNKLNINYDNPASARSVPKFTVSEETFEERSESAHWIVDNGDGKRPSPEGDISSVTERFLKSGSMWDGNEDESREDDDSRVLQPKSVHFAPEDEVAMFEAHEMETNKHNAAMQRTGNPRRGGGSRVPVKRSSSFENRKPSPNRRRGPGNEPRSRLNSDPSIQVKDLAPRSYTDFDLSPQKITKTDANGFPIKRSNSWTALTTSEDLEVPPRSHTPPGVRGGVPSRPSTRPGGEQGWDDHRDPETFKTSSEILTAKKTYVESKAVKMEARERAEKAVQDERERTPGKGPRPILRRTRSASDFDRKQEAKQGKPKGILVKSQSADEPEPEVQKLSKKPQPQRAVVKINGVYVSRNREAKQPPSPQKQAPVEVRKASDVKKNVEENEREGARNFARCLLGILPSVLSLNDPITVDEALQQFASDVCEAVTCMSLRRKNVPNFGTLRGRSDLVDESSGKGATSDPHYPILNADGVYVTVYTTLSLNFKLLISGHYQKKTSTPPLTQQEFVDSILNSGVIVGLSSVWLGELYRLVTTYNILGKAGYQPKNPGTNRALVSLLSENIFASEKDTGDDTFLNQQEPSHMTPARREGTKFARRVLLTTWSSVLEVLSLPLETSTSAFIVAMGTSNGIAAMLGGDTRRDHNRERDTICLSLDGLRRAARLSCTLGIQTRCELVLALLANASCGVEGSGGKRARAHAPHVPVKLHAAHVLSMDGLLAVGVELGSHAPKCWRHVFRCCTYIAELERQHINSSGLDPSQLTLPTTPRKNHDLTSPLSDTSSISDYLNGDSSPNSDKSRRGESSPNSGGLLNPADASRAIFALSAAVDRLFEHAANTLNVEALLSFLQSLIQASQTQLFGNPQETSLSTGVIAGSTVQQSAATTLHLYRIADVMLRCARNANRPLLHLLRGWSVLAPHFVEWNGINLEFYFEQYIMCMSHSLRKHAACHRDHQIAKLSITSLHDVLTELLSKRTELPHFWFHEMLFKPFENILALELCGEEEQDQIIATLSEMVDGHSVSIKSGWRSVFGAVRSVRIYTRNNFENYEPDSRAALVFNVISSFLNNKNPAVFGAAAVQCIQTLLKIVRGSAHDEPPDDSRSDNDSIMSSESGTISDMCLPALDYLSNISKKLASIHIMPSSLVFHGAHAIRLQDTSNQEVPEGGLGASPTKQNTGMKMKTISATSAATITSIDDTGILRVWYLLLEGLTNAVSHCPRRYQPQTLEVLFDILRSITTVPGANFSIYTVTNLLLPMLRNWVYRGERNRHYWESTAANFKHACGLATELIVEELPQFLSVQGAAECVPGMVKQILDLLIDCVSQPVEGIARLGCSCLRHLLLSGGPLFTEDLWQIVCDGLQEAVQATLFDIKDLVTCFQPSSNSVTGDEGMIVKVVARREGMYSDPIRLQQVAEQVFLLDSQVIGFPVRKGGETREETSDEEETRTYVFVLSTFENKDKPEMANRVSLRSLIVGLLSHQLLLQTISSILLDSNDTLNQSMSSIPAVMATELASDSSVESPESVLPGLLSYLSPANLSVLFDCLMESHTVAYEFNARPGLRSLIQKLAKLDAPANLLRQSTTAFTCYLHTLFQICKHSGEHFSSSHIKRILTGDRVNGNPSNGNHVLGNGNGNGNQVHSNGNHAHSNGFHGNEKEEVAKDEVLSSPNRHNDLLKGDRSVDWIVRRLHEACDQLTSVYVRMLSQYSSEPQYTYNIQTEFDFDRSLSWTPISSPARDHGIFNPDELPNSPSVSGKRRQSPDYKSRDRTRQHLDDDLRMIELERQMLKRKEDELLQLGVWTSLVSTMLEALLGLPTLQFKAVLPAVFPAVTGLVASGTDPKVRQLVCDVVRRVGVIYGIL
ncbi:predicted protein [Nematostella vectensis]|uniref:Brefeldin A-inhibited guanine nucleotide-exchange protein 3 n=1 Tax=Nematostella vectensis TaxID=45351 RepID=A7SIS0_NEMVE|nr:predicted protein [Nematostella vectensis]|eukprot:XP_001628451.1 predicted protein [Nematostella vectensis]